MVHLDEETILQLTVGALATSRAGAAEQHLSECPECRARQQNISSIVFSKTVAGPISSTPDARTTKPDRPSAEGGLVPQKGMSLGHYVLLDKLGAGGMGEVFAAFDPRLDRRVALKLLRAGTLSAEEGRARLLREAQAMARLSHPNVIAVHDVGTFGDRVFIAMEFVDGETLGDWLRGERAWRDVVAAFVQAGRGLEAAHSAGLVHRDFKPDNVLMGNDRRPRVVDFGLARQHHKTPAAATPAPDVIVTDSTLGQPLTRDGAVMGTPGYMAPEQIAGMPTDARSDQFSFCVALYEALYGKRPYGGATLMAHAGEIAQGRLLPPPSNTPVPSEVYDALARGLSNDPAKRWPDMTALLGALEPKQGLSGRLVTLVASLAVLALAGASLAVWQQRRLRVCGGSEKRLTGIWDDAKKSAVRGAFLSTKASTAPEVWKKVERTLDGWALEWVNVSRDACEAARVRKVDSEEVYELRQTCLETRLDSLKAEVNLFSGADVEIVSSAPAAAAALEPPSLCLDARALSRQQLDPAEREATRQLEKVMAEAKVLFDASRYAAGVAALAPAIAPQASELGQAEALLLLEHLQRRAGQVKEANASLVQAAEHATRAKDASALALSFSRLAVAGNEDARAQADVWLKLAHAAAATVTDDWRIEAELETNEGIIATQRRDPVGAQRHFTRALTLQEQHLGPNHPEVAQTYNWLGVTLTNQNQFDAAIGFYEKSLALHLALEGPIHASTASAEHNLAITLRRKGHYDDALGHFERARLARVEVLGAEHPDTLKTIEGIARTMQHLDRQEEAITLSLELLAARERTAGLMSKEVAWTHEHLSELYASAEAWPEALSHARKELAVALALKGLDDALTARAHLTLASALVGAGQWDEAKRSLAEAMRIRIKAHGEDSAEVAVVLLAQGKLALEQRKGFEARVIYERAVALRERLGGATNEALADAKAGLGRALLLLNEPGLARAQLDEALELLKESDDHRRAPRVKVELARALLSTTPPELERARLLLAEAAPLLPTRERARLAPLLDRVGLADAGP